MQVDRRREMNKRVGVEGFYGGGGEKLSVLKERTAVVGFGGSSS